MFLCTKCYERLARKVVYLALNLSVIYTRFSPYVRNLVVSGLGTLYYFKYR